MQPHGNIIKDNLGKFITIEGIDGCGKSTLAKNLAEKLPAALKIGAAIVLTKEPGGSELGKSLRKILQEQKEPVCDKSEYLLFAADRAQHFKQIIQPALLSSKIVISDRWGDSSVAYQGYGRGLDVEMIKAINTWATRSDFFSAGLKPDLIFYIRIDAQTAFDRIKKRNLELTAFEKEKIEFWGCVANGYEELFKNNKNVVVLDGKMGQDELLKQAMAQCRDLLGA